MGGGEFVHHEKFTGFRRIKIYITVVFGNYLYVGAAAFITESQGSLFSMIRVISINILNRRKVQLTKIFANQKL